MIWQMLTKILFNTLSVCCFILIIIVLHGEVADPTVQRDLFMAFLMHTFFFLILLQNFMLENYKLYKKFPEYWRHLMLGF